jgi:hypothetical protein
VDLEEAAAAGRAMEVVDVLRDRRLYDAHVLQLDERGGRDSARRR